MLLLMVELSMCIELTKIFHLYYNKYTITKTTVFLFYKFLILYENAKLKKKKKRKCFGYVIHIAEI